MSRKHFIIEIVINMLYKLPDFSAQFHDRAGWKKLKTKSQHPGGRLVVYDDDLIILGNSHPYSAEILRNNKWKPLTDEDDLPVISDFEVIVHQSESEPTLLVIGKSSFLYTVSLCQKARTERGK